MPLTAVEIKARLDKAVDQEGNVLDMEAVLDIVSYLERVALTKEALETTRIGRTINLMRKKTSNEDLSRRAKELVKKWQALVNNHFKKIRKSDSLLNNGPSPPANINGVRRNEHERSSLRSGSKDHRPHSCTKEMQSKTGLKRKRTSAGSVPLNIKPVSPKMIRSSNTSSPKQKLSRLVTGDSKSSSVSPPVVNRVETKSTEIHKRLQVTTNSHERVSPACKRGIQNNTNSGKLNNGHNKVVKRDIKADEPTDTRIQEDRIGDDHSKAITNNPCSSLDLSADIMQSKTTTIEQNEKVREEFLPVEAEDLAIVRKYLPEDITTPNTQADGVNGVYDEHDKWCEWTEVVPQRENELHLLPYVILD